MFHFSVCLPSSHVSASHVCIVDTWCCCWQQYELIKMCRGKLFTCHHNLTQEAGDQRSNLGDIVPCNWTSVHSTGSSVRKSVLTGEPSSWRRVTHHHQPWTSRDTFNTFQLDFTRLWMYLLRISISLVTLIFHSIQSLLYSLEYES